MSDSSSALLFSQLFSALARRPSPEHKAVAKELWERLDEYDFSHSQLDCEEDLQTLGLARKVEDEFGDMVWEYGPEGDR